MFSILKRSTLINSKIPLSKLFLNNIKARFQSSASNTIKHATPPKAPTGIKKLIHQYGYSALGVYLGLSLIDLPICYIIVHSAGEDKIREMQDDFFSMIGYKTKTEEIKQDNQNNEGESEGENEEKKSSTFLTEFAVAYALHKSLVFIRLPITAAITPWVVARLQRMGFKIGKFGTNEIKIAVNKAKKFDPTGKSSNL
ncbi:hypothetical protein C6P40_004575 [Pichia californica]|uniref:DUF1279 domain-containing protein n=1 Tax=Pichia californica TaxID=460514 RepID=A0A9P7BHQ0_9ASCO|nr:hypothetical protein C6P42_003493 [[Candida] californica]KAG0689718.1 hypothetical protein C6P40_004575 [[Candida] californica]